MTITVGVPVFNAKQTIQFCLENLARQTFQDIKVLVLDNASNDGTSELVARFVESDSRFSYYRQPFNKGARQSFIDVLCLASTDYFMWRADDDLSDLNYIAELHRLLEANPYCALAVGKAILDKKGRRRRRTFPRCWSF